MDYSSKLKVFHINYSDIGGGAEEFAFDLSQKQENAVLYVGKKYTDAIHVKQIPKPVFAQFFSLLDKIAWKLGFKRSFKALFGIQDELHSTFKILKNNSDFLNADIIHLHNIHGEFFNLRDLRKIASIKPVVWTVHDMWIMTGGEGFVFDGMTETERRRAYPMRNPIFDTRTYYQKLKKKLINEIATKIILVAPSKDHFANLISYFPKAHIKLVPYGISIDLFNPFNIIKTNIPTVVIFNSRSIYKRSKQIIQAIKQTRSDFQLHVIGMKLKVENRVVINHGWIRDRNSLAELFQKIDIGAFASNHETFGLLPTELAACGGHVFLNRDLDVFHEHVGLYGAELFNDPYHLAKKIDLAVKNIDQTRSLGMKSAEKIEEKFDRSKTVIFYEELYSKVLAHYKNIKHPK